VHPNVGAVDADFFGGHREVDCLKQGIRSGVRLRSGYRLPMAEGEEANSFHSGFSTGCCFDIPSTLAQLFRH
jgi:hypothetical protein